MNEFLNNIMHAEWLWILLSLLATLLWASQVYIDQWLMNKVLNEDGSEDSVVGSLFIFSSLAGVITAFVIGLFTWSDLWIGFDRIGILIVAGMIMAGWLFSYLNAIENEEASIAMPLYEFSSIVGLGIGWFLLQETLLVAQLIGVAVILVGALILTIERHEGGFKIKGKLIGLMLLASILLTLYGGLFKLGTASDTLHAFWIGSFWQFLGLGIVGLLFFTFHTKYRGEFISVLKTRGKKVISWNIFNELLGILGFLTSHGALLLTPIALVFALHSFTSVWVFVIGIVLSIFFPTIHKEEMGRSILLKKIIAICIIILGAYLIG